MDSTFILLTIARDAIFMVPGELRLRIFHPPRAVLRRRSRALIAPVFSFLDDPHWLLYGTISPALFTRTPKLTIDGIDYVFRKEFEGKPAQKEGRRKKVDPSADRTYESYVSVPVVDRIKNLRSGRTRAAEKSSVPLSFLFGERRAACVAPILPLFLCGT